MFIGKIVPLNLSALEEVPGWVSGGIEKMWRIGDCWGWTTRQYGPQCQVLCIYCILLHCTIHNSLCPSTGMSSTFISLHIHEK